jgi:hypothetical protein
MIITLNEDGCLDLESLKELLDISKVVYYHLEELKGSLVVTFYNKNKKVVRSYGTKKENKKSKKNKD